MDNMLVPGVVTSADRSEMERLRRIMDGAGRGTVVESHDYVVHSEASIDPATYDYSEPPLQGVACSPQDVMAMADILKKFHASEQPATLLEKRVSQDDNKPQPSRTKAPIWTVQEGETDSGTAYYDVGNGSHYLARRLPLREVATALAKMFNRGLYLNHPAVQEVMDLERAYSDQRRTVVKLAKEAKAFAGQNDRNAVAVFKKRLDEAKQSLLTTKAKLGRIAKND